MLQEAEMADKKTECHKNLQLAIPETQERTLSLRERLALARLKRMLSEAEMANKKTECRQKMQAAIPEAEMADKNTECHKKMQAAIPETQERTLSSRERLAQAVGRYKAYKARKNLSRKAAATLVPKSKARPKVRCEVGSE